MLKVQLYIELTLYNRKHSKLYITYSYLPLLSRYFYTLYFKTLTYQNNLFLKIHFTKY